MKGYAYYNGQVGQCDDIKIPLSDRIIFFGDGVYDVIIGHDGKLFLPEEHLNRLLSNMEYLHINIPWTKAQLYDLIYNLIELSGYKSYMIYISASRDQDERIHSYKSSRATNLLIIINSFKLSEKDGLSLITEEDKRYRFCNIKTVNLLPSVLASTKADLSMCDEAVFHRKNIVTECAHSNIFIVKNERLITHPKSELILPGITRGLVIDIARKHRIHIEERPFSIHELFTADEAIITSTTKLIKPANYINGLPAKKKVNNVATTLQREATKRYLEI